MSAAQIFAALQQNHRYTWLICSSQLSPARADECSTLVVSSTSQWWFQAPDSHQGLFLFRGLGCFAQPTRRNQLLFRRRATEHRERQQICSHTAVQRASGYSAAIPIGSPTPAGTLQAATSNASDRRIGRRHLSAPIQSVCLSTLLPIFPSVHFLCPPRLLPR